MTEVKAKTVLVVDDSRFFRALMGHALAEEGYGTVEAQSGEEALEVLERDPAVADLVLLDLVLPGKNGFQVLEALRSSGRSREVPVIVATQHGLNSLEREILRKHRATAVLTKASSVERILFEVRSALFPQESEGRRSPRLPITLAVTAKCATGTYLTTTFNLSEHGMFLVVADSEPPKPGAGVELKFWIPNGERIHQVQARVAWVNSAEAGLRRSHPPGFAVEYVEPHEDAVEAIRAFIEHNAG